VFLEADFYPGIATDVAYKQAWYPQALAGKESDASLESFGPV